ncbi:MAG: TetR/AcrR family transcriptional regulator [Acidimicrobiia bacterium]
MTAGDTAVLPRRADARRNREQVLAAAEAVFSERGVKAPIEEVARRAGVGVGTVCRHYPTKQALVDAVVHRLLEPLIERARPALDATDPGEAFRNFVFALSDVQARHVALAEQMAYEIDGAMEKGPLRAELRTIANELLVRAQAAGSIRADIGAADVSMLFSGAAHATSLVGEHQEELRHRYVTVILDGLRPMGASALPGHPMDYDEMQRVKSVGRARGGNTSGARR